MIKNLFKRVRCFFVCGPDRAVHLNPNTHTWRCKGCGVDLGSLR